MVWDSSQLDAGWHRSNGWGWSMQVNAPTITVNGKATIGGDLSYSDQGGWKNLVDKFAGTFGPFFASVLGASLMRSETRVALLASGTLGLLTDYSQYPIFKSSGLSWSGFDEIKLKDFTDPLKILRDQVSSNFSTSDKAKKPVGPSLMGTYICNKSTRL